MPQASLPWTYGLGFRVRDSRVQDSRVQDSRLQDCRFRILGFGSFEVSC